MAALTILALAFIQNVSFTLVSRSRNRDNKKYHIVCAIFSNGIWFLTFRELVTRDMTLTLFIPYTLGTVSGSVYGMSVAMWIERILGAQSDSHIKKPDKFKQLQDQVDDLEAKVSILTHECESARLQRPDPDPA